MFTNEQKEKEIKLQEEKENKKNDSGNLSDKLFKTRIVTLFDSVNAKISREIIQSIFLLEHENKNEPIHFYINSPGGEVNSGFAIYDVIRFVETEVKIICSGLCASIATVILLAAKKENRFSLPNTKFLIHQPLIGGVTGPVSDVEITANEIVKTRGKINDLISQETGQNIEKIKTDTDRDFWMNAEEALQYGLISKIVKNKKEI